MERDPLLRRLETHAVVACGAMAVVALALRRGNPDAAIGVLAGSLVAQHVSSKVLSYVAGAGFIAIGIWTMVTAGGD